MKALSKLTHKEFIHLNADNAAAAKQVNLVYVNDSAAAGILRLKTNNGFAYKYNNKTVKDKNILNRIKQLVIPPAWESVWICHLPNGHLQATGYDARKRKQYRYHVLWNYLRSQTKFHHMIEFGKALPQLRLRIEKDFSQKELNEEKVIATVLALMERTYIRIGNEDYEKQNGSYGLTTLKDKHVAIKGDKMQFVFKGKKGVMHNINLQNKKLAKAVKDCRDVPGKELFQYYMKDGTHKSIDSGSVNNYIKTATGGEFTAKDFRTWAGSLNILRSFAALEEAVDEKNTKQNILKALDEVSRKLGNTRTVCKKYYVHPSLIEMYEEGKLNAYLKQLNNIEINDNVSGLTKDEKILMQLLQKKND